MLRVFLAGPPLAHRADPWVRHDAHGRPIARGQNVPAQWPADAPMEVVLAADQVRLIALDLPSMQSNRLRAAARFALEDQLATPIDESALAIARMQQGTVLVAVTADALVRAIATRAQRIARIIPESALAPYGDGWTWCASAHGDAFVRRADGSAFAVGASGSTADAPPPELVAALTQASRAGDAPGAVHVTFRCDAAQLAHWTQATGIRFVAAPEWHWERATPAMFASAPDFLDADDASQTSSNTLPLARAFRPALLLATIALAVHLGALAAQWAWLSVEHWQLSRALVDEAAAAQLPDAASPNAAAAAIARQSADLRHRAAQSAPADALPLLARAAPVLGALPPGALRSAHYTDAAWTLELGRMDAESLSRVTRALALAGVDALSAPTSAGARMRLSLAATAR